MAVISTQLVVDAEGRVSLATPLPAGEYAVTIVGAEDASITQAEREQRIKDFVWPEIDLGPWPEGIKLDREEIYGDDGR